MVAIAINALGAERNTSARSGTRGDRRTRSKLLPSLFHELPPSPIAQFLIIALILSPTRHLIGTRSSVKTR